MDNFKLEYLSLPMFDENEELLYYIALNYEYRCEMFDRNIVLSNGYELKMRGDRVFLPSGKLTRISGVYAREERKFVLELLEKLRVPYVRYKSYISKVDRLTYDGLVREYEHIPKEIFDKIEELTK